MGKRLTDSAKWNHKWFRQLPPEYKLLWLYICDNCDAAGIWEIDLDAANFVINSEYSKITLNLLLSYFKDSVSLLQRENKVFLLLTSFIKFQYKGELNENFRPHIPVLQSIAKYELYRENDKFYSKLTVSLEQVYTNFSVSLQLQDKDKEKDIYNNINNNTNKNLLTNISLSDKETQEKKLTPKKNNFKIENIEDEDWRNVFILWITYKKERNETYKTASSLETCYKRLLKLSENNIEMAKEIIENSIANNYSGLFPSHQKFIKNNTTTATTNIHDRNAKKYAEMVKDYNQEQANNGADNKKLNP
jgi:hypothetical protein